MSRIVDEDVVGPIKTHVATDAYREGWDRVFGEPEKSDDGTIEQRILALAAKISKVGGEPNAVRVRYLSPELVERLRSYGFDVRTDPEMDDVTLWVGNVTDLK